MLLQILRCKLDDVLLLSAFASWLLVERAVACWELLPAWSINPMYGSEAQALWVQSHGRFGLSRGNNAKRAALQNGGSSPAPAPDAAAVPGGAPTDGTSMDFNTKLLHLAWHPEVNLIAAAASNSLYMYYAR